MCARKTGWTYQIWGHSVANQCCKSEISLSLFYFGKLQVCFSFLSLSARLCEQASLSLWGMTCLVVEGSSCALDLVCVVLPCPVIGSRLLAAACAGGLQPGRNPSTQCHMASFQPCQAMPTMLPCTAVWPNTPLQPGQCAISPHFQDSNWLLNNVGSRRLRGKW